MNTVLVTVVVMMLTSHVTGHGRLIDPPSRSTAFRYGFITPPNYMDMQLNCGGFWNQWGTNQGRCGVCGDSYQGPRQNEAGGIYATGIIVKRYNEGQEIVAEIEMTVGHGGWSEFKMCPNNNISRPVTQQCLDKYPLATPTGETRVMHKHVARKLKIPLILPRGLTCTQCVLQWKWKTDSNNNCNAVTGENCCTGCGPQEEFYGCADVAIQPDANGGLGQLLFG